MLKHSFDPHLPHRYVRYLRMSSDMQNERSPIQQADTIQATLVRCKVPWILVQDYTDSAVSGRLVYKRPAGIAGQPRS
jgi:DNA invertase Pin-like site-specific DNA recombinase